MKRNAYLLVIEAMLALMTACFVQMPDTIFSLDFLFGWTIAFCFYFCLFAPAWQFRDKQSYCNVARRNCNACLTECKSKGYDCPQ